MSTVRFLCLNVPDIDLQLFVRRSSRSDRPEVPILIVESDRPSARIYALNATAVTKGIRVGMRYSEALSLSSEAVAGVVTSEERHHAIREIKQILSRFVPTVTVWELSHSVFWGDVRGMTRLGAGSEEWFHEVRVALSAAQWWGGVVLGWTLPGTLFGAYEIAAATASSHEIGEKVFPSEREERRWTMSRRIEPLPLKGRDRDRLSLLGVTRVDGLLSLPPGSLKYRFSSDFYDLYRFLTGSDVFIPVQPSSTPPRMHRRVRTYEPPIRDDETLLTECDALIETVLPNVRTAGLWVRQLQFEMNDDRGATHIETIECGTLTRDHRYLHRLVALRVENREWRAREIVSISLSMTGEQVVTRQGDLLCVEEEPYNDRYDGARSYDGISSTDDDASSSKESPQRASSRGAISNRPSDQAEETLALVRAQLGNVTVFYMYRRPGRLPEQRFAIEPLVNIRVFAMDQAILCSSIEPRRIQRIRRLMRDRSPVQQRSAEGGAERRLVSNRVGSTAIYNRYIQSEPWWDDEGRDRTYAYQCHNDGEMRWIYRRDGEKRYVLQGVVS